MKDGLSTCRDQYANGEPLNSGRQQSHNIQKEQWMKKFACTKRKKGLVWPLILNDNHKLFVAQKDYDIALRPRWWRYLINAKKTTTKSRHKVSVIPHAIACISHSDFVKES